MKLFSRIITSLFFISLIAGVLVFAPAWVFSIGVSIFSALGLFEFLTMLKKRGVQVYRFFGVCMGFVIPLVIHFQLGQTEAGEVLFVALSCFSLFLIQFGREENPRALEGIALTFFGVMYIGWFLSHLVKLKFMPHGALWIAYLFSVTKIGDVGAFFIGSLWGKHSLIPHISPNKSIEGTCAGLAASGLLSICFLNLLPVHFSFMHLLIMGVVIGVVSQCGDLAESLIKRYCGIKDSGKGFPGFGGVLDIMDSVLFTVPLFYFYIKTTL